MKSKILVINPIHQYGYGAGYSYYPQYLKENFDVDFICLKKDKIIPNEPGFNVIYFESKHNNKHIKLISFVIYCIKRSYLIKYNNIFCVYFSLSFLIGLFGKSKNKIIDIRTGSLEKNKLYNFIGNTYYKISTIPFNRITVLSDSLRNRLKLSRSKTSIVPLGAIKISTQEKKYNQLNLIYVGVFTKRNIHLTIIGLANYIKKRATKLTVHYDIIGFGDKCDIELITKTIKDYNLDKIVILHNRKNHEELKLFFDVANIGVAFVPITDFFDVQPSTKIFEYSLSGMITIATNTHENKKLINSNNGYLCDDNPDSFSDTLCKLEKEIDKFNYDAISNSLSDYTWSNIVNHRLSKLFI